MNQRLSICLFAAAIATGCNQSAPPQSAPKLAKAAASQPSTRPAPKGKGESPKDRDQKDDDGVIRRGTDLTKSAALHVSTCIADAEKHNGKTVKVEGTVVNVCAAKGCWFAIQDDKTKETIRITSKGYRFFVPRDAKGKRAIIEGDLAMTVLSEADAKHLAEDSGQDSSTVQGPQKEVQIAAIGLEMRDAMNKAQ